MSIAILMFQQIDAPPPRGTPLRELGALPCRQQAGQGLVGVTLEFARWLFYCTTAIRPPAARSAALFGDRVSGEAICTLRRITAACPIYLELCDAKALTCYEDRHR